MTQSQRQRRTGWLAVAAALFVVALVQIWICTAGNWSVWPEYSHFYSYLADAFVHGQTSLRFRPPTEILALPDPYDPLANAPWRLHDAILFNGKYYLYWGPVPALLAAVVCKILGVTHPQFGDQYMVWTFLFGTVLLGAMLLMQVRRQLFPEQKLSPALAAIFSFGLGTPMLFALSRPAVYEAAIAAGQFFFMTAMLTAWFGVQTGHKLVLAVAGVCFALSFGSRLSLGPATLAVGMIVAWKLWPRDRHLGGALAILAPQAVGVALLLWYNYIRFGSFTEFGLRYQLAGENQHLASSGFWSPIHVAASVASDLLAFPYRVAHFPYFTAMTDPSVVGEPIVGLLWAQPFLLLAIAALHRSGRMWLTVALILAVLLGLAPTLGLLANMRYLLDFVPCCTILAAIGYWHILRRQTPRSATALVLPWCVGVVIAAQCVLGLLLAWDGYDGHFAIHNPPLYNAMQSFFGALK